MTDHKRLSARSRQARKRLPQERGDLQQQLAGSHLQSKRTATFGRIDCIFGMDGKRIYCSFVNLWK